MIINYNVFDSTTLPSGNHRSSNPAVAICNQGKILFNKAAALLLSTSDKAKEKGVSVIYITFFQDQDNPANWYLSADYPEGFAAKMLKSGAYSIIHRPLATKILDSLSATGSARIPICRIPEVINGKVLMRLDTRKATVK